MTWQNIQMLTSTIQALATVGALLVGGIWSYLVFIRKREKYARAEIKHSISHRPIAPGKVLLTVEITVANTGGVLLELVSAETLVKHTLPPSPEIQRLLAKKTKGPAIDQITGWPLLAEQPEDWEKGAVQIEPGECEPLQYNFFINDDVQTIFVSSRFQNKRRNDQQLSWRRTTVYDLKPLALSNVPTP